jgi:hypothetical protein
LVQDLELSRTDFGTTQKIFFELERGGLSDANYEVDRVYPIAVAIANGVVTGL